MKVACYVRVSSEEQKIHGYSLDAQREKLTAYAHDHNYEIIDWYCDEGVSGRKLIKNRPELQRMIIDGEQGKFQKIIFIKLDRFFRSVAEYHECMKRLNNMEWTATEEQYDMSTAQGRMLVNMKLTIAELEADQTGERIKLVNEYKVKQGQAIYGERALPFGYTTQKIDGIKRVVKSDKKEIVIDMINFYRQCESIGKTSAYMFEKYKISYDVVLGFFKSSIICGCYRDNYNFNEPYISIEEFNRIQENIKRNCRYSSIKKRWYIVSTQSGKEREIAQDIMTRAKFYNKTSEIVDTLIVEHEVPVMRNGKETGKTVMKNKYPRYIYVQMNMTDDAWFIVRNTPGVTGIIGSSGKGTKPIPVPDDAMKDVLRQAGKYDEETASRFQVGDKIFILYIVAFYS